MLLIVSVAAAALFSSQPRDTLPWVFAAASRVSVVPAAEPDTGGDTTLHPLVSHDTVRDTTPPRRHRERPKAIEYSDWYGRRLAIHKWASYTTLPLFAAQYITGNQLLKEGRTATPARYIHGPVATAIAGLFAVNTVTGVWNLAESWPDPAGRTQRTIHSTLMLLSDAGFVVAGELAKPGLNSSVKRQQHVRIALTSMGVSLVGYLMMLPPFRSN